jgi:hypothetical protein
MELVLGLIFSIAFLAFLIGLFAAVSHAVWSIFDD